MQKAAFTFVEVLISLAICALLVGTICSALIHVTRLERSTAVLREIPFHLQTLACQSYLSHESTADIANRLPPAWSAQPENELTDDGVEETPWLRWRLSPANDPSFSYTCSIRDDLGPWQGR